MRAPPDQNSPLAFKIHGVARKRYRRQDMSLNHNRRWLNWRGKKLLRLNGSVTIQLRRLTEAGYW